QLHVVDCLHSGRVQRQDHHFDAVLIHLAQPRVLYIDQTMAQVGPYVRPEYLRIAQRGFDGDVFLECDLALHEILPVRAASCNGAAAVVSISATKKPPKWAACKS